MAHLFHSNEEIQTLRRRFLFADDSRVDSIIKTESWQNPDEITVEEARDMLQAYLTRCDNELRGDQMSKLINFPRRHADNLGAAVAAGHAGWDAKLAAIREDLGTGAIVALLGERGTGKTQLATALARAVIEHGHDARYQVLGDVYTAIKATFKDEARQSERDILSSLGRADLLVLDEVHECGGTDWNVRVLTLLIDARYREKRDTILIANLTPDALLKAVGPSIASRMDECGFFVECGWPSFRGAKRI